MDPKKRSRDSEISIARSFVRKVFIITMMLGFILYLYDAMYKEHPFISVPPPKEKNQPRKGPSDQEKLQKFIFNMDHLPEGIILDKTAGFESSYKINDSQSVCNVDEGISDEESLRRMSTQNLSIYFENYITTLQCICKEPKRLGSVSYGGFRICADEYFRPRPGCLVHSYNHEMSARFETHIRLKYNCSAACYEKENSSFLEFKEQIKKQNITSILILKIDKRDFPFLSNFFYSIRNLSVRQIILEIHVKRQTETKDDYIQLLTGLKTLQKSNCGIYWFDRNWEFVTDSRTDHSRANCFTVNMQCDNTGLIYRSTRGYMLERKLPNIKPIGRSYRERAVVLKYTAMFVKYVIKHQILCRKVRRMGRIVDGGWDICDDPKFRPRSPCIVYSFGINYDFSFDEGMEKTYGCDVFAFDPSMRTGDYKHTKHIHFYQIGLSDKVAKTESNWTLKTLQTLTRELGHENRRIDVLKMDIEGNEKQSLVEMIASNILKNVVQLVVEFHSYHDIGTMRKLYDIGFRIFWSHQNPGAPLYAIDETFSYGNEVSFVNINNT